MNGPQSHMEEEMMGGPGPGPGPMPGMPPHFQPYYRYVRLTPNYRGNHL